MAAEAQPNAAGPVIRHLRPDDAAQISSILGRVPEAVFWPESAVREVLAWDSALGLVIESAGSVTAFLLARQMADEAEILNLAVEKESRRKGKGALLLQAAEEELLARGAKRFFLEVRESNFAAIAFYKKHGFAQAGRRADYYKDPEEGAIMMEKHLSV